MTAEIPGPPTPPPIPTTETAAHDLLPFFDDRLREQGGDIAVVETGTPRRVIVVGHPDYIRHVFDGSVFADKGSAYQDVVSPVIGDGIVTSSGEKWVLHRNLLSPVLRPAAIRRRVDEIAEEGDKFVTDLLARTKEDGRPFDLQTEMTRLTLGVITRFLCGKALAPLAETHISLEDVRGIFDAIRIRQRQGGMVTEDQQRRIDQTLDKFDTATRVLVGAARERPEEETVLSKLAYAQDTQTHEPWSDKDIRDEFVTLLFAGHETMELSLSWFFHLLQQHPEILTRIRQELQETPEDASGTAPSRRSGHYPFMDNVVSEMWRLYPPTPVISRSVKRETQLGGIAVAPGDEIIVSIWHGQRHPSAWESPGRPPADQFDPARFPLTDQERPAYFPFAAGRRACLGLFLARTEIAVLAPLLLQRTGGLHILSHEEKVRAVADLTLQPSRRLMARIGQND